MSVRTAVLASVAAAAMAMPIVENLHDRAFYEAKFFDWMKEHKIEAKNGEHLVKMIQNFANNDDLIETHNAKKATYTLGHNKFSAMSNDEFAAYVHSGGVKRPTDRNSSAKFLHKAPADVSALPSSIDWTTKGAVAAVKDQGQCGSCWSFSTVCALEGAYAIKYGTLTTFSEQYFVSCDNRKHGGSDMGCNGGLMDSAFEWAETNGVCSEASYPYVSGDSKDSEDCLSTGVKVSGASPKSYTDVTPDSDSAMMSALAQQPVSIAIEADQTAFQLYKSGVFTATCGDSLDHGVTAVGYGTEDGQDYYLVRNSWGDSWGEAGYIKLERGGSQKHGQCGMLSEPSYPNL
jgi:C1A family cysteine protease